jgi:hypothetical protein
MAQAARIAVAFAAAVLLAMPAAAAPDKDLRWAQLSVAQQKILEPLGSQWDRLEPEQRVKWIGVAKRYPKFTPVGQKRTQTRMKKWAKLTPEQRRQARENYRRISKVAPDKRSDLPRKWDEYQSLPPRKKPAPAK